MNKKYILLLFVVLSIFLSGSNIYAQDCMALYKGGLTLMNKKDKSSYQEAIKKFEAAEFCDTKLRDDCRKRISECKKAMDALPSTPAPGPAPTTTKPPSTKPAPTTPKTTSTSPKPASPPEPATVRLSEDKVKFTEQGGIENVTVSGDDKWSVSETADWCDAKRGGNLVVITCNPNKTTLPRKATLEIKGINSSKTVSIEQEAGKPLQADVPEPVVETEKPESKRENVPVQASSGSSDTVVRRDISRRNLTPARDTESRREATPEQPISRGHSNVSGSSGYSPIYDDDSDERKVSSGRKISIGFMANVLMPSFSVNSSSALGSAVNYGYGGKSETPSYSSDPGYGGGLVADIRIAKNIYIQTGLYYTNMSVNNKIKGERNDKILEYTPSTYLEGTFSCNITEKYTLNYIELPILLSYRFHLSEKFIWQINAGPYIGYGIQGKAKIQGTQDWRLMEYNNSNDRPVTNEEYRRHNNLTGEIDLFGKTGSSYITGESQPHSHNFRNAPFQNLNAGVSLGTVFEYAGINVGVYYDMGLMNIANENYWKSERMSINNETGNVENAGINNYVHKLNKIQIRVGYIYRW